MGISGKTIAQQILDRLTREVQRFKKEGKTPTLAVILVGDDPSSLSYIKQKQKAAEYIGARVIFAHLPQTISKEKLASTIAHYNDDPSVHGLIVQRPVPAALGDVGEILNRVSPAKDVDGFIPHSPFEVPVARAVLTILEDVYARLHDVRLVTHDFKSWLNAQKIVVIGRGDTAGKPIAKTLATYDCTTSIVHSHTPHPREILRSATVIISCVGKSKIVTKRMIKPGVILISVGLWRDSKGKSHGDYEEDDIKNIAGCYTPTPGGVGPVNVACLMQNLVDAVRLTI